MGKTTIDLESISFEAHNTISALDKSYVGTDNYMGIAWFWHVDYKHYLREQSYSTLMKVHRAFLKAGLRVSEDSDEHYAIVRKITKLK